MKTPKLPTLAALALFGCAAPQASGPRESTLDLTGRVQEETRACIPVHSGRALTIAGPHTLTIEDGATLWVTELGAGCGSLRAFDTLLFEGQGGRYCRGDRIRTLDPGGALAGPACPLGEFTAWRRAR